MPGKLHTNLRESTQHLVWLPTKRRLSGSFEKPSLNKRKGRMSGYILGVIFLGFAQLTLLSFPCLAESTSQHGFLTRVPDLPLMDGLKEIEEAGFVFDKPSGRIVESYAQGGVSAPAVLAFYNSTLPQLGWQTVDKGHFVREGERLEIAILGSQAQILVRFTLLPQP